MFPAIRYVTSTLAECLLNSSIIIPADGDPVFKVEARISFIDEWHFNVNSSFCGLIFFYPLIQVLGAGGEVLSDKLFSRMNKRCQSCSYWRGCRTRVGRQQYSRKDYVLSLVLRAMFNGLFSFVEKCMCNWWKVLHGPR